MKIEDIKTCVVGNPPPHFGGFHAEIVKEPIRWEDGYIIPPTAPGLGVELDEEVAERHPYSGDILYIDMVERPV